MEEKKSSPEPMPAAAKRALEEAAARRMQQDKKNTQKASDPKELGGPKGEEPTRYGDWERGGRAIDF